MIEILEGSLCDRVYNASTNHLEIIKQYHIYWNPSTKTVFIREPIRTSVLHRLKRLLRYHYVNYKNIIIGTPDI